MNTESFGEDPPFWPKPPSPWCGTSILRECLEPLSKLPSLVALSLNEWLYHVKAEFQCVWPAPALSNFHRDTSRSPYGASQISPIACTPPYLFTPHPPQLTCH